MTTSPIVDYREEQPYAAIRACVAGDDIPALLPPLVPEVIAWLSMNHITPAGPPFFRYLSMDADRRFLVDVGMPVQQAIAADGRIVAGAFPAGSYASVTHTGDFRHLREAHMLLEDWMDKAGLNDKTESPAGSITWKGRTEFYLSDPKLEPNPEVWRTEIAFLL